MLTNLSEAMSPLCGLSPLWDSDLFWSSTGPGFTPCLEHLGLPLLQLLFLLCVLPIEVEDHQSSHQQHQHYDLCLLLTSLSPL